MGGPWEKYQQQPALGPWTKYAPARVASPAQPAAVPRQWGPQDIRPESIAGDYRTGAQDPNYRGSWLPFLDPINAAATNAVESIPVAGPFLAGLGNQVDAGWASMLEGRTVTPEERQRINEADQAQYPISTALGGVTGTVAPFLALGATAPGAAALGVTGSLGQRVGFGAGTGGAISFADAIARGDSWGEAGLKGMYGAMGGGGFPLAERFVGSLGRWVTGQAGPDAATKTLVRAAQRDQINPADIPARLVALGPDAVPADLGPNLGRQAAAIAALPGQGQLTVRSAMDARQAGMNSRIQQSADDILGPAPVPSRIDAGIRDDQRTLGPFYEMALRNAKYSDTRPLAQRLDGMVRSLRGEAQSAVEQVRGMLNAPGSRTLDPNANTLFQVRQAIDGMMEGANNKVRGVLAEIRAEVDGLLTKAAPGIKSVDAKYAELARQREALETGQTAFDSGRSAIRPQELDAMMTEGAIPQGLLVGPSGVPFRLSQGGRADIDRIIGTTANNLNALKSALKGDGSWNRQRMVSLFGPDKAERLLKVLDRESAYNRTYDLTMRNSETAARQQAQKDVAPMEFGQRPTGIADIFLRAPQAIANTAAKARSESVNAQLAQLLMSSPSLSQVEKMMLARYLANQPGMVAPGAVPMLANPLGGGRE